MSYYKSILACLTEEEKKNAHVVACPTCDGRGGKKEALAMMPSTCEDCCGKGVKILIEEPTHD